MNRRCFGCGRSLEASVECRLTEIPDERSDVYLSAPKTVERTASGFRPASSFPHFSLGFPRLDSLLRPFTPGFMAVASGAEAQVIAELAAFKAQLPLEMGDLDSTVVLIDGGNHFDPYSFCSLARQRDSRPNTTMRSMAACRAFTMYQPADLISQRLVPAAADYSAQLVVISDLLDTFNEPKFEEGEAKRLLGPVEQAIRLVKRNALVLVTLVSPSGYDDTIISWADTVVSLASQAAGSAPSSSNTPASLDRLQLQT